MMATLTKQSVTGKAYPYNLTTKPTTVNIELPTSVEVKQTEEKEDQIINQLRISDDKLCSTAKSSNLTTGSCDREYCLNVS